MRVSLKQREGPGGDDAGWRRWYPTPLVAGPLEETRHEKLPVFPRDCTARYWDRSRALRSDAIALANASKIPSPAPSALFFPYVYNILFFLPRPLVSSLVRPYRKYNWRFANPLSGLVWQVAFAAQCYRRRAARSPSSSPFLKTSSLGIYGVPCAARTNS